MTLVELLRKHDIKELWYILSKLDPLPRIRAERLYKLYEAAISEMLETTPQPALGKLVCEFECDGSNGGAPEVSFCCSLLNDGEYSSYGFCEWAELLLCEVDSSCIEKYGTLVVAAELLWEKTAYGYSREEARQAKIVLDGVRKDSVDRHCQEPECPLKETKAISFERFKDEFERDTQKDDFYETECRNWLLQIPNVVKKALIEKIKKEFFGHNEYDSVLDEELLDLLKGEIINSGFVYKNYNSSRGIIESLAQKLDCDDLRYLLEDVWEM